MKTLLCILKQSAVIIHYKSAGTAEVSMLHGMCV